jgi:hypothetical protein
MNDPLMENPLLDLWREHGSPEVQRAADEAFLDWAKANKAGEDRPEPVSPYQAKRDAQSKYAWAVPSDAALDRLVKCSPLVEIGAGLGYWAALLADRGADIVAYDLHTPANDGEGRSTNWFPGATKLYYPVQRGGAPRAADHPDRTLFLCWPPYGTAMANTALQAYERAGGRQVVYIGESAEGCTGDGAFHRRLDRRWNEIDEVDVPQWPGLHDYMTIYERKDG